MFSSQEPNSFVAGVDVLSYFTAYGDPAAHTPLNVTKRNTTTQPRDYRRTCCDWDPRLAVRGGGDVGASRPLLQAECLFDVQHHRVLHKAEKEPHNTRSVFSAYPELLTHREFITAPNHRPPRLETHRDAYPETPRTIYICEPSMRDSLISCQKSIPSVALPPKLHTHEPQHPDTAMSNSVISIRGSITISVVSNDSPSTLGTLGLVHPRDSPVTSERKVTHPGRTLDHSSNPSEDMSVITLPSFVEPERCTPIPSPILTPPGLVMVEDARSLPSSRQSSPLFHSSRSPGRVADIMTSTTPSLTTYPRRDFPSPTLPVPDWRSHSPHRTRSSTRRAGMRRELSIGKSKSEIQVQPSRVAQPGIPGTLRQLRTNRPRLGTLPPLKIPTRTSPLLGGGDSQPMGDRPPSYEERDTGVVLHDRSWLVPPRPSPSDTLRGPVDPEDTSPALSTDGAAGPTLSTLSPAFSSSNSPSSYSSPHERRVRVVSRNRSSTSMIPSVLAFPSPPGFTPGSRDGALLVVSSYSTPRQPFPTATLWENNPVGSIETASPNEGQTLTPLPDAETPQTMPTVNSRSILNGYLHPELMGRDGTSVWSEVYSRISSMRRLSRTPLGPRQMSRGHTALQSRGHPPSV